MNQKSPFKFLDAYNEQDHDIFFGRDQETEALYDALSGVKHLLVYGPSGAGKTSLIECGLRNQFSDADWYALTIRRGADLNRSVLTAIRESLDDDTELPDDTPFGKAIERLFAERFQPVYLLFDQFEELLISGEAEEKKTFFTRLNELIQYKVPCRVLLIMREEFVGHLSEYEKECPSIFQHRFRLEKMGRADVRAVISKTLQAEQYRDAFSVAAPDALTDKILSKLPDNQRIIELAHVQVFLNELWERAHQAPNNTAVPQLRADLVNDKDSLQTVLDEFLKKQIDSLDHTYGEHNTLYTLAAMISERDTKLQVSQAEIEDALRQNEVTLQQALPQLLDTLAKHRIIRTLKSGGQTQYEISHDLLAKVVGDNRTEEMKMQDKARRRYNDIIEEEHSELLSQKDINTLRRYEEVLPFPPEIEKLVQKSERRLKAKRRRQTAGLLAFSAFALLIAGIAVYFYQDAKIQAKVAQDKTQNLKDVLDALYFYGDSLALAFNGNLYGYINKKGELLIDYGYNEATAFNDTGYAKVKRHNNRYLTEYLIDKKGVEYRWTNDINELNGNIEAFDFNERNEFTKNKVWQKVLRNTQLKVLILKKCNIKTLPPEIGQLKGLRYLNLGFNQLSTLPPEIVQLKELHKLDLSANQFNVFPPEIGQLKELQKLDLSSNQSNTLLPEIGQLKELQKLDLSNNQLNILPSEIIQLKGVQVLDLMSNQFNIFPPEIGHLKELLYLNLNVNKLSILPPEIGQLKELQELHLHRNQLNILPAEIGQLKELRYLGLETNGLSVLPPEIGQLNNLQRLHLSYNKLSILPSEIGELKELRYLNLIANNLRVLPTEIGQLNNLQRLYSGYNQLSILPSEIGELKELRYLNLVANNLRVLPAEIRQLSKLQKLDLGDNQFNVFPPEIGELKELRYLNLVANNLRVLPAEIRQLSKLQKLDLGDNQFNIFPPEIGQLKKLRYLNLTTNDLRVLPAEIGQLSKLQKLDLGDNQFNIFPSEIGQLKELRYLSLGRNQLNSLSAEIVQLNNLQELFLSSNQFNILSAEIIQLKELQKLYLRDNQLTSLPPEIGQLNNLQRLDLRDNNFSQEEKQKIKKLLPNCEIWF